MRSLLHSSVFLLLLMLFGWTSSSRSAVAQEAGISASEIAAAPASARVKRQARGSQRDPVHFTAELLRPERAGTLRSQRIRGRASAAKASPARVGDGRAFHARNVLDPSTWHDVQARLVYRSPQVNLWVEESEIAPLEAAQHLPRIVDSLALYLSRRTPAPSLDPALGTLDLLHRYFGRPPNVDGDGALDVLLLDVRDRYEATGAYVAGFFDPADLTDHPFSNRRDLLYVDLYPTLVREGALRVGEAAATIAHEYQHLVHAGYEGEEREHTFINEGLSELAEVLCGFEPRPATAYFQQPARSLFSWDYEDPLPDYARASLWTHYLFEQIGYEHVARLVQSPAVGLADVRGLLREAGEPPFERLFLNWGRALLLGDRVLDPAYGYRHPVRSGLRMPAATVEKALPAASTVPAPALSHALVDVPLTRRLDVRAAVDGEASLTVSAVVRYPDSSVELVEDVLAGGGRVESGRLRHGGVTLLVTNLDEAGDLASPAADVDLFLNGEKAGRRVLLRYDDGVPDAFSGNASYLLMRGSEEAVAVAFAAEEATWLYAISAKLLFLSELQGTALPRSEDRDVVLEVRAFRDGKPGALLTEPRRVDVRRPFGNARAEVLSLLDGYADLAAVRDSFCVVLRNDADDANDVAVAMDYAGAGHAYFQEASSDGRWRPMCERTVRGARLDGWNPMVQAHTVQSQVPPTSYPLTPAFEHDFATVRLVFPVPPTLDSLRTRCVAESPSGRFITGRYLSPSDATSSALTFTFPIDAEGTYAFHLSLATDEQSPLQTARFTWTLPQTSVVEALSTYPNPSSGASVLAFRLHERSRVSAYVFDLLGRRVHGVGPRRYERGAHDLPLSLHELPSGVYLARVLAEPLAGGAARRATAKVVLAR